MGFLGFLCYDNVHNNVLDCIIVFHSTNMLQLKFSNAIENINQNLHFFSLTSQCLLRRIVLSWTYNVFGLPSEKTQFSYSELCCIQCNSLWTFGRRRQVTNQDGKPEMGVSHNYRQVLFGTSWLSLPRCWPLPALETRVHLGSWKISMTRPLQSIPTQR